MMRVKSDIEQSNEWMRKNKSGSARDEEEKEYRQHTELSQFSN